MHYSSLGVVILLLYVDDMLITRSDIEGIQHLKKLLSKSLKMKNLGHVTYFLGLKSHLLEVILLVQGNSQRIC